MGKRHKALSKLDDMAFQAIRNLDPLRRTEDRNSYYDGYCSGVAGMAGHFREVIREIDPDFDSKETDNDAD